MHNTQHYIKTAAMFTKIIQRFSILFILLMTISCDKTPEINYLDGTTGSFKNFESRWLIINYWATWCKPCIEEIPELNKLNNEHTQVQVIGINFDKKNSDELKEDKNIMGITFPIALNHMHTHYAYDYPNVLPTTVIISPSGNITAILKGPQTAKRLLEMIQQH